MHRREVQLLDLVEGGALSLRDALEAFGAGLGGERPRPDRRRGRRCVRRPCSPRAGTADYMVDDRRQRRGTLYEDSSIDISRRAGRRGGSTCFRAGPCAGLDNHHGYPPVRGGPERHLPYPDHGAGVQQQRARDRQRRGCGGRGFACDAREGARARDGADQLPLPLGPRPRQPGVCGRPDHRPRIHADEVGDGPSR